MHEEPTYPMPGLTSLGSGPFDTGRGYVRPSAFNPNSATSKLGSGDYESSMKLNCLVFKPALSNLALYLSQGTYPESTLLSAMR